MGQAAQTVTPESTGFIIPAVPSWQGRLMTGLVRLIVKRWPRDNVPALVRRSRWVFSSPAILTAPYIRGLEVRQVDENGVRGEWLIPPQAADKKVLLYLHGGAYISCSPQSHRPITATLAKLLHWRVFALDYRLAPENPFPAAVDDAAVCYRWLLKQGIAAHDILVAGDSAGGGLALALMLRLRREGSELPAAAVCFAPWVDLTGKCQYRNDKNCAMFRGSDVGAFACLYLNGAPAESEEASPVFADLHGLPPLLIQVSSSELLLDEATRLHENAQAAGVSSRLSIYPGLSHVWQIFGRLVPESGMALKEAAEFMRAASPVS